jgi:rhodanese-related sulfurtransferase
VPTQTVGAKEQRPVFDLFHREPKGYEDLSPTQVHEKLQAGGRVQLVDVRSPGEYANGHIPKARLIPLNELPRRAAEVDTGAEVIIYCHSSARSRKAAAQLAKLGYDQVYNMTGGLVAWPYGLTR